MSVVRIPPVLRQATGGEREIEVAGGTVSAVLDDISGGGDPKSGMTHGQGFFRSFRDLTSSGFWTSKMGIEDLGYMGNTFVAEWKGCPPAVLTKLGLP